MADIKTIRKRGFAIDDEEHVVGLRCVAAVVCSPQSDAICALSVSGLANRLSAARANAVASHVVSAGQELAQKIGLC
jgi:IclR family acetate operon transcriptional repressor